MARKLATKNAETSVDSVIRSIFARLLGKTHEGRRDLYEVLGYPKMIMPEDLYNMYSRNDIAHRIVSAYPKATWRELPIVRDEQGESSELGEGHSPFCESVESFFKRMKVTRMLERADRLSTIGQFGVLFLGFDDNLSSEKPLEGKAKLLFASPYHQASVQVASYVTDTKSPRYGLPEVYTLQSFNIENTQNPGPKRTIRAHHSRVIHIAENLDQDDTNGMPRLQPIYNRLIDLEKVVGGGAETFWLNANRGMMFNVDPNLTLDEPAKTKIKEQAEELQHKLRRTLVGQGVTAQPLGSDVADPKPNAEVLLDLIAGAVGIPKRILLGTERGELSSSQDENNWSDRIQERRENHATPNILQPFIQKMIDTGNIDTPAGEWWIEWPTKGALGPVAESDILVKRTTALTQYALSPDAQMIVPPQEFRRDFLGIDPESEYEIEDPVDIPEDEPVDELPEEPADPEATDQPDIGDGEEFVDAANAAIANMAPKPLYVSRNVRNVEAFRKWAKEQGLDEYEATEPLHVTVCYSKAPMDWLAVSQSYGEDDDGSILVQPGGPRVVEQFGNSIVLSFVSDGLSWRHRELKQAGASHDFAKYQPHITICKVPEGMKIDLIEIEPYTGAIALGPEIFEDIKD